MKFLYVLSLLATVAAMLAAAQSTVVVTSALNANYYANLYYERLKNFDATIMGMNALSQNAAGVNEEASISLGTSDFLNSKVLWQDNAFRMNTGCDTMYTAVALRLVSLNVLPALTVPIPSQFLPKGITNFYNPSFVGIGITMEMLMRHTSTLSDASFDSYRQSTPTGLVSDFPTFCESYFTTSSVVNGVTTYSASQAIWTTGTPGSASSYFYARANTALMAYVVNAAILGNPALVSGTTKDAAGYLQEQLLGPLGMSSTFRRSTDGSFPRTTLPSNMDLYSGLPVVDISSTGTLQSDVYIHPAYPSDYMYLTTTENVGRFVRSLFIETTGSTTAPLLASVGSQMRLSPLNVQSSSAKKAAQVAQSYGLQHYNGADLCAAALSFVDSLNCLLTNANSIYGSYSVGTNTMWGYFCITVNSQTTCTTVMLHYFNAALGAKDATLLLGAAAVMLNDAVGGYDDGSDSQYSDGSSSFDEGLNGLWVALGTCLVIVFVFAAAYFTEYLVQPAPVPAGIVAAPPPIPQAYGQVEHGMYADGAPGFYHD